MVYIPFFELCYFDHRHFSEFPKTQTSRDVSFKKG